MEKNNVTVNSQPYEEKIRRIKVYNRKMGFAFEEPLKHYNIYRNIVFIRSDSFKHFLLNNGMILKIIEDEIPELGYSFSKITCLNGKQITKKVSLDEMHRSFKIGKYNNPRTQNTKVAPQWTTNPYYMCMLRARNLCFYAALPEYKNSVNFLEDNRYFTYEIK